MTGKPPSKKPSSRPPDSLSGRQGVPPTASHQSHGYDAYGSDDVLTLRELPDPKVGPGEVRIRVRRAGVNPVDWKVMAGGLDGLMDVVFPVVPGWDVAGMVETVGIDTPEFEVGDEVVAYARKDVVQGGTFAEFVTMSVRGVARKSAGLSWDEAGGLPLTGLTGLQTLDRLGVSASDTVLVHGGAGGVGTLAVQIAKARSARVIATAYAAQELQRAPLAIDGLIRDGVLRLDPMVGPNNARYITRTSIEEYRQRSESPMHRGHSAVTW